MGSWPMLAKPSLLRAHERLGSEPLRVLFTATDPAAGRREHTRHVLAGLRLVPVAVAVDNTYWDVADTAADASAFGRPGNTRGADKSA
ncbi:hypothetical protein ABZV77_01245 [Streptomyces sp. NPDC004732]|uniref:hypothetical protein n=1 Tax=Streptomyces sp. NPDC004732 TaxID=3154290 RepID=UPI0033A42480